MKIEVVRPFCLAGINQPVGTEIDVPDAQALELIAMRKAIGVISLEKPKRGRPAKVAEPAA